MSDNSGDFDGNFDEFLRAWTEERIVPFGFGVDHGDRELMLKRRAEELLDLATKRGFGHELSNLAKQHGDLRGYVSSLYRLAESER